MLNEPATFLGLPVATSDVALYGGILGALLMLAAFFRDVHVRGWTHLDGPSAGLKIVGFFVAVLVALAGHAGGIELKAHDAASDAEITRLQTAIGTVQTGGVVRNLTQSQIASLTSAFRSPPLGLKVDVERCISDGSALPLQADFVKAFDDAGLPVGGNNTTASCGSGVVFGYAQGDTATATFIRDALQRAQISAVSVLPVPTGIVPMPLVNGIVVFISPKTASSL